MVKIRLRRVGAKKRPVYRVVVADSRTPRDGQYIEAIGHYDPRADPPLVRIDEARALYWLGKGAQPTEAVARFLEKLGIMDKWNRVRAGEKLEDVLAEAAPGGPTLEKAALERPVGELGLSSRVVNILAAAGISKVGELRKAWDDGTLSALPGLGPKSLGEIEGVLRAVSRG